MPRLVITFDRIFKRLKERLAREQALRAKGVLVLKAKPPARPPTPSAR